MRSSFSPVAVILGICFVCFGTSWSILPQVECSEEDGAHEDGAREVGSRDACISRHDHHGKTAFECFHPLGESAVGGVIKVVEDIACSKDCQEQCANEPECTYFAYVTHTSKCRLYRKNPTSTKPEEGVITGPKTCNSSCWQFDTIYAAEVLVSGKMYSPFDCQVWCQDTNSCLYWLWEGAKDGVNGNCHLIEDGAGFRGHSYMEGAIAGDKAFCDGEARELPPEDYRCIHKDAYPVSGQQYRAVKNVSNFLNCRTVCVRDRACRYWSYNLQDRSCRLWKGDATDMVVKEGFMTGPRECQAFCVYPKTGATGTEVAPTKTKFSPYDCIMSCYKTPGCKHIAYEDDAKLCHYLGSDATSEANKDGWSYGNTDYCYED